MNLFEKVDTFLIERVFEPIAAPDRSKNLALFFLAGAIMCWIFCLFLTTFTFTHSLLLFTVIMIDTVLYYGWSSEVKKDGVIPRSRISTTISRHMFLIFIPGFFVFTCMQINK